MGLYLCVLAGPPSAGDDELEAVDVGMYSDFHAFRQAVADRLEPGGWGTRFPTLMLHSDCDGEWTPSEAEALGHELRTIAEEFDRLPAQPFLEGWPARLAREFGIEPKSLAGCFIDVDGEPLLERLRELAGVAVAAGRPISFQ
jgi:hypothetical protein